MTAQGSHFTSFALQFGTMTALIRSVVAGASVGDAADSSGINFSAARRIINDARKKRIKNRMVLAEHNLFCQRFARGLTPDQVAHRLCECPVAMRWHHALWLRDDPSQSVAIASEPDRPITESERRYLRACDDLIARDQKLAEEQRRLREQRQRGKKPGAGTRWQNQDFTHSTRVREHRDDQQGAD